MHEDDLAATSAVGEAPYPLPPKKIPTDKEMQELKDHIKKMKVRIFNTLILKLLWFKII